MNALLSSLKSGDHVICFDDVYGGTNRMFRKIFEKFGITNSFLDFSDLKVVEKNIKKETKYIWFETPSNPLLKVVDIAKVVALAKKYKITTVCDNTFASPIL